MKLFMLRAAVWLVNVIDNMIDLRPTERVSINHLASALQAVAVHYQLCYHGAPEDDGIGEAPTI